MNFLQISLLIALVLFAVTGLAFWRWQGFKTGLLAFSGLSIAFLGILVLAMP